MTSKTASPALPVWATVAEAFATVPANLAALLQIFWAWIAVALAYGAITVGFWTLLWPTRPPPDASLAPFIVPALLLMAVVLVGFSSTAVAWHRLLLLGEQPPLLYLRVGGPVPRYAGRLVVITLIVTGVELFCAMLLWRVGMVAPPSPDVLPSAEDDLSRILATLIVSVVAVLVTTRLSISLPGIAIEQPTTLGATLHLTRDNAWRLCGGTLLIFAPSYVLAFLLGISTASSNTMATLLLVCASFFSTVATISFLSLGYRFFTRSPAAAQPQPV